MDPNDVAKFFGTQADGCCELAFELARMMAGKTGQMVDGDKPFLFLDEADGGGDQRIDGGGMGRKKASKEIVYAIYLFF